MNGTTTLLVIFLLAALVAIGSGVSIGSPLLIGAGVVVGAIGVWLSVRGRKRGLG